MGLRHQALQQPGLPECGVRVSAGSSTDQLSERSRCAGGWRYRAGNPSTPHSAQTDLAIAARSAALRLDPESHHVSVKAQFKYRLACGLEAKYPVSNPATVHLRR